MSLEIVPIKRENDPERARHVCKSKGQWAFQGSLGPRCLMVALSRVLSKPRPTEESSLPMGQSPVTQLLEAIG